MATDSTRTWQLVLDSIESELLSGALKPGDHLPPERALAASLKVGRSSVREALRVLEVLGLIRTQTGSGPQSGAIIVASPSGGMGALMRLQLAAQGFQVADIVRSRLLLETAVVKDLADHSDTVDFGPAAQLLDAMEAPELSREEFLALDAQFHLTLAELSDNQVVTAVMVGLRTSIEGYVIEGAANLPDWQATMDRLRAEHRAITMAIIAGDGADAATRIHDHISGYYAESHLASSVRSAGITPDRRPDHG
jgi:GntR family transcriptional repressor for pyruvate dehydrogenase complex